MQCKGVETVVDRNITGQSIENALLRFDGKHGSPSRHRSRPLDRVDTYIGAAVDGYDAVAVMAATKVDQVERHFDLVEIKACGLKDLKADTIATLGINHAVVKSVDDHRSVLGRSKYERQLASHPFLLRGEKESKEI
jgi:hypothetical protein